MCNLSQGIEEKGIAIGEARKEEKIILNMHNNGFTVEQIASQLPYRHMLNVWHKSSFKGTGVILYL